MIRPANFLRTFALALAGGSFLLGTGPAAVADTPESPALPVTGARLNIAPLRLELDAAHAAVTLRLTNTSSRALPVQSRMFAWSQEAGEDRYVPSTELTISPSIVSIAPGQTQIVRVLRSGTASPGEKRFRLAVDQLPDPTLAKSGQAEARLRFTIPVFLDRDQAKPAQLEWRLTASRLELHNAGGLTVRIFDMQLKGANGLPVKLERNGVRYALGGSTIAWDLTNGCALGNAAIAAQIDALTTNVQVSPTCG